MRGLSTQPLSLPGKAGLPSLGGWAVRVSQSSGPAVCRVAGAHMTVGGVDTINLATFNFHNLLAREEVQVHLETSWAGMFSEYLPSLPLPSLPLLVCS